MAIGRTNTGGGIKLFVVGGTTQPTAVAENTIWLNTSTSIPKWSVQNDAPPSPSAGEVYITTRNLTSNVVTVSGPNPVKVYLGTAWQYVSGAWKQVAAKVYYSGSWHSLSTFVYDGSKNAGSGNYNDDIGGKPWTTGVDGGAVEAWDSTDHFSFKGNGVAGVAWYMTANQIDFTAIKSVKVTFTSTYLARSFRFVVTGSKTSSAVQNPLAGSATYSASYSARQTATIDTTSLNGSYWLGGMISGTSGDTTVNVFSIELVS